MDGGRARKVVGVGARAFIVLLQGLDANDPLFLQVEAATASVLRKPIQEPLPAAGRTRGAGTTDDVGVQRQSTLASSTGGDGAP